MDNTGRAAVAAIALATAAVACGCSDRDSAPGPTSTASPTTTTAVASPIPASGAEGEDWCRSQGGTVSARPVSAGAEPGSTVRMCEFAGGLVSVGVDTLSAGTPSEAQKAYVRKTTPPTPSTESTPSGPRPPGLPNPASVYCLSLGATSRTITRPDGDDGICVFGDRSVIAEWTLTYHAHGDDRGVDLTPKFRAWLE